MPLGPRGMILGVLMTNTFAHLAKPQACPRKLDTEYGQPDWNYDQARTRCDQHYYAKQHDSRADRQYGYPAGGPVSEVHNSANHICWRLPLIDFL